MTDFCVRVTGLRSLLSCLRSRRMILVQGQGRLAEALARLPYAHLFVKLRAGWDTGRAGWDTGRAGWDTGRAG